MKAVIGQLSLVLAALLSGIFIGSQADGIGQLIEPSQNSAASETSQKPKSSRTIKSVFQTFVEADLNRQLSSSKKNSPWLNVSQVKMDDHSTLGKSLISDLKLGSLTEKAPHHIEVVILDIIDSQRSGVTVQLKLVDTAKNNRIEEVSRTYFFDEVVVN